jgi:hypothetical protein
MRETLTYIGLDGNYYKDIRYLDLANKVNKYWNLLITEVYLPGHIQKEFLYTYEFYFKKLQRWKKGNTHSMKTRSKTKITPFVCGSC